MIYHLADISLGQVISKTTSLISIRSNLGSTLVQQRVLKLTSHTIFYLGMSGLTGAEQEITDNFTALYKHDQKYVDETFCMERFECFSATSHLTFDDSVNEMSSHSLYCIEIDEIMCLKAFEETRWNQQRTHSYRVFNHSLYWYADSVTARLGFHPSVQMGDISIRTQQLWSPLGWSKVFCPFATRDQATLNDLTA